MTTDIERYHFVALRAAVRLEQKGMTRRPSARQIAIKELMLPTRAGYDVVIDALTRKIDPPKFIPAQTEEKLYCRYCGQGIDYCICESLC